MSGSGAQNSLYKSVLASKVEMDPHLSTLSFNLGYPFDLGHEKLPGPLPPLPDWMLDTPMYSKLPMVPAPKGKIVLFTTRLCKKLHQTPDDLDFDPVAAGLCSEYKSLHDPHLKSHYTRQVTYDRLIKSGYITPDGMVKCSLKEFNDYHQYLKSVRLEKITQERKRMLLEERERLSRERKESIQKDVDERDRLIKASLIRQKKVRDRESKKLSHKLQDDYRKTMIRLVEQRRKKMALQQTRRKVSEEKHHAIRTFLETEEKLKKALIKAKRTAEEIRRADLMKVRRKKEKEEKERKLEDEWSRREEARAERFAREKAALAKQREEMFFKVERRDKKVTRHREKQQDIFFQIREERHNQALNKELTIAKQLGKRIHGLCRKYSAVPKRGRRCFPVINPKMATNMTTWSILEKQKQGSISDARSKGRLPPIISSDESGSSLARKRIGPPSMAIYDASSLPSVKSSVVSTGDAPVSLPEVMDSFTLVAKQLVSTVFKELKADPEFENLEWKDAERPGNPNIYIDASEVSPQASRMVADALKTAVNQLEGSQPSLGKVTTLEDRAQTVVSSVIDGSLKSLLPSSHIELVENKQASAPKHPSEEVDDLGQRSYKVDERLAGGSEDTVMLSSIIEMFQEPPEDVPSITHTEASSEESESEADEDEGDAVIGIVENTILMDEMEHAGGPSGDMDIDEGLHVVMHKAQDGHLVVDGAVLTVEHDEQTITERILSDITLERASGSLSGTSSSHSGLAGEEAAPSSSTKDKGEEVFPEDHSFIVPIYQKHLINLGGDLVKSHLAAISMKPEAAGRFPSRGKCAARNSFRNIFRPDMTYCQGSARMLRDTLVKDIKSRQTSSLPSGMDTVCEVLEQEEHDIMEKHSDEALVAMEESEGLCYLPPRKKKPKPVAPEAPPAAAPIQADTRTAALPSKTSEVPPAKSKEATSVIADATDGKDGLPVATAVNAKAASSDQASTEQKTEIIPASKSATEVRERALSAEKRSTKREVSAQSVDASPNLAASDEGNASNSSSGEDSSARKRASRKSKKVTRSSAVISSVMSRLSHVFSGSHKKSNASVPSHESSSEPASRQTSKKSLEGMTGGALSEVAQTQDRTASGEGANIMAINAHQGSSVHHGASVHFTAMTVDPPVKKQSIYESHHRPQTPIPHMHIDVDDEEEEEVEVVINGGCAEEDVSMGGVDEEAVPVSHGESLTAEGPTNPDNPPEPRLQVENDSNNAQTESVSMSPACLPSIITCQLQPPLVPSEQTSTLSQLRDDPTPSGSQASQGYKRWVPPQVRSPSDHSLTGVQSMTITGRSMTPVGFKVVKSVTSTEEKERGPSVGEVIPRSPSGRGSRAHPRRRVGSLQKRASVSSQSASKVKSAYRSAAGLSISGCQILPNKPPYSSSSSYSRRSSRTQAGLISATELGSTPGSRHRNGSRGSVVMPRPPYGVKPSGSAQSGHRVVKQPPGAHAMLNPTLTTGKGSSSVFTNHQGSNERLLKRRVSLGKENRMERLSTESVSSRRSSKEKVAKKKSSGTQPKEEESLQEEKSGAPMPPIKESLTPRPPSQPRQRSRPTSGVKKAVEEDAGQRMIGVDQVPSEE